MTKLMAILNVTPDSYYDGGLHLDPEEALKRALQIFEEGADILDIGGESTRPGAAAVSVAEEIRRVVPAIRAIRAHTPLPISIDTSKPAVAEAALEAGATFINDVSGFRNKEMRRIAATAGVDICVMHMQGSPGTMQTNPHYVRGIIPELLDFFDAQVDLLLDAGVDPERILLDPGIGFGKTVADNLRIIQNLPIIKERGFRLLLGLSRKSFLQRLLNGPASEMLAGTLVMNTLAVRAGVDIVRVHDVRPHRDMITLVEQLQRC